MGPIPNDTPLVVIVGETASGKSALAMELARQFNGEIICADSRTIYKGMDIGTAKPSAQDRAAVPHHLLDIATPEQRFTAADFKQLANQAIVDISDLDKLPIMVGGTGLYVDSVLYDYQFSQSDAVRDLQNPRHLAEADSSDNKLRSSTLVIGIETDRDLLKQRIQNRVEAMFAAGLEAEVTELSGRYGWDVPGLQTIGYQEFRSQDSNEQITDQLKEQIVKATTAYAKRQRTWFKRNKSIHWVQDLAQAKMLVQNFLSKAP